MNTFQDSNPQDATGRSLLKSVLLTLPIFVILLLLTTQGQLPKDNLRAISSILTLLFLTVIFFLFIYTGKTYKYRKVLFTAIALSLPIPFITHFLEIRGSMSFDVEEVLRSQVPFCHIVISMVLIPAALTKTIIFPGSLIQGFASISSMLIIWIGVSLSLGKGWCSWACFYGGYDEGFTYLSRKPKLKIGERWANLPFAVLIAVVITSAATLSPTYCFWACPFKTVTEFEKITSPTVFIQTVIFLSLFIGLVMVFPILTGKRTQCTLFCPFGALQSFTNKINIFDIRMDREKCKDCNKCIRACPTLSINKDSLQNGKALITCTKCGGCIDACTKSAVSYHIKGTKVGIRTETARILFLYAAFIFGAAIGGGMIAGTIFAFLKFFTTGSFI